MAELARQSAADPRHTAPGLLHVLRDGRWRTRAELRAVAGPGWPFLLAALESDGHVLARERSKVAPGWFRLRLAYEATPAPTAETPDALQLDLGVDGSAPPRSAVLGLEEAA